MAPMKRNRNRDRKNVCRRVKNSGRKGRKYIRSSDGSQVERLAKRKLTGYKLETTGLSKQRKYQRMGAGRLSKLTRGGKQRSSDCESDSRDSEENRGRRYVQKALEFGLASGYLIPDEDSGRRVLRVTSEIEQFVGGSGAEQSRSEGRPDGSMEGRGRSSRVGRAAGGKRLITKSQKNERNNVRKRGRSKTKSPRKPAAQKRRKKRSESRTKLEPQVQKRKGATDVRNEPPSSTGRSAANNEDGADDEDDEPEPDNDADSDNNSDEKNNKLAVTSRPGSIVPNSDEQANDGDKKKSRDDEPSGPSGEEGSTEEAAALREDEGLEEEDANEGGQEQNPNIG